MSHTFGKVSMVNYNTLHPDLQLVLAHSLITCEIDFSITEGYRPPKKQFEYFKKGRKQNEDGEWIVVDKKKIITNIDGYKIIGSHNQLPSIAVDIAVYIPLKPHLTYDSVHLAFIAGSILRIADRLYSEDRIVHKVRWGGDWNKNGDFTDSSLSDMPHFELYKP